VVDLSPNECRIDGFGPLPVVTPQSVAELSDTVRRAAAAGQAIYPLGGRTMLDLGLPPSKPGIAVDLTRLDQVIDYPARDMTITVQAGITIARLQSILAGEKQQLPVDVPLPERATLGGALATNVSGPRRYGYGTLRDYVIGISVINDQGHEVKVGGRVVKNVAGYDLCKLYIGSLGTLGVITQVTLKVRPQAEERAILIVGCTPSDVDRALEVVHESQTRPISIDLVNAEHGCARSLTDPGSPSLWLLLLGFESNRQSIQWQTERVRAELQPVLAPTSASVRQLPDPAALWQTLVDFRAGTETGLFFKANLLPHAVARFCQAVDSLPEKPRLIAHAGNGIVLGHIPGDLTLARAQVIVSDLQELAAAEQGNVIIQRCPAPWKTELPIWGKPRGDVWLMRAVKDRLDPGRLFNPGRFVDSL
jgi:glycolate oxidase FAD binding subunit